MDSGLHGFIATVEISMLMFPVPHSIQVHNGTNHITNINLCINEFLMGFGRAREARTKSRFVMRFSLLSSRAKKNLRV